LIQLIIQEIQFDYHLGQIETIKGLIGYFSIKTMNLFTCRLLAICGLICIALLFQIMISSNLVVAIESSESNTNKISSGSELESIVTNGSSTNQLAYRNSQHGIFMLFPSNWTFSNSGLPEYTQVAAFYGPLQNLSDPIPPRLTITVMNYQQNVSLKDFTNMTLSSLNQTNQVKILSSSLKSKLYKGQRKIKKLRNKRTENKLRFIYLV